MQPGTIAIVLVAALAHAVWNTVSKYKRGDTFLFVWAYTSAATLLCLPLALAALAAGSQTLSWQLAAGAVVSAALHVTYSLTLQSGYDRFDLGVVYPVARGTGPVLTLLFAILLFGERLSAIAILGAVVVVAGIVVVAGNPFRAGARHPFRGVLWGAATGAAIAGYTLWDSLSVTTLHLDPVTYFTGTFLVQSLVLTPFALRRRSRIRFTLLADAGPILTVAVLSPLAYILVLTAMQTAPVALVAPLRESSIVIGSLLAWWLFREAHLARRIVGAVIVLAGIAAISL
ncbi:transporter [Subtercola boreus]|uniref:Transporter n=1 Tax=Subtercola boreus TaxID=120213 RepID=A0A3E0VMR3_9MICO|nr:DMT family transporter [Subtercola boreus]RFA10750.1 transporter [Subtercola boreus]TQL55680.1 EamA-like transporter family protein [Subtercola boreus]